MKVSTVEVKDVELPADMQRAIARQAEAERERRAKIISADGEFQAAEKLVPGGRHHQPQPGDAPAPLPADAARHRRQPELDDHLPAAARHDEAVPRAVGAGAMARARARAESPLGPLSAPEVRIDQLTGLRAILAPGRAERPGRLRAGAGRDRATTRPRPARSARAARTAPRPRSGRGGPAAGRPTRRAGPSARCRTSTRCSPPRSAESRRRASEPPRRRRDRAGELRRPAAGLEPGDASRTCSRRMPAAGAHEVIVHSPEHATSLAELSEERFAGAVAAWRERMRAGAEEASYVHLIVNEGPDAGASLEHSHAQLYALRFVPAEIARERERAVGLPRAHHGRPPAVRRRDRGGAPRASAWSRSTTRRSWSAPGRRARRSSCG